MSYRDHLDRRSEKICHTWTRPKKAKSQVNGQTQPTQSLLVLAHEARKHQF